MDEQRVLSIPLFAGLSKAERRTIAKHADELDFEAASTSCARASSRTSSSSSRRGTPR